MSEPVETFAPQSEARPREDVVSRTPAVVLPVESGDDVDLDDEMVDEDDLDMDDDLGEDVEEELDLDRDDDSDEFLNKSEGLLDDGDDYRNN